MSSLTIPVEILAGTDFKNAVKDASDLSRKLDIAYVTFKFNGISVSASQRADPEKLYKQYLDISSSPYDFIIG